MCVRVIKSGQVYSSVCVRVTHCYTNLILRYNKLYWFCTGSVRVGCRPVISSLMFTPLA